MKLLFNHWEHQATARKWFLAGLKRLGVADLGPDVVVGWGWRLGRQKKSLKNHVLVFERGYLGDRFKYTSLAFDGLNGRARFPACPDDGGERFRACGFTLKPRRTGGSYVLVIGQVPTDVAVSWTDITAWYEKAAERYRHLGLPVLFRPHPLAPPDAGAPRLPVCPAGTLQEALDGAALVVTFNSNTGVDALMNGNEVVAWDEGSMIWPIARHELGTQWDKREQWAYSLAWKQWAPDEICSGEALKGVMEYLRERR